MIYKDRELKIRIYKHRINSSAFVKNALLEEKDKIRKLYEKYLVDKSRNLRCSIEETHLYLNSWKPKQLLTFQCRNVYNKITRRGKLK